jgi:hypothetical protein
MDHFAASVGVAKLIYDIDETKHQDFVVSGGDAVGGIARGGGRVTIGDYYSRNLIVGAPSNSLRSRDHELERITRQVV